MTEILYILFGWLLGLLSPQIIDAIKTTRQRRNLTLAIRSEAEDLQYRLAITSFLLAQRYCDVSRDYLAWLKPKLLHYQGDEPVERISQFVQTLANMDDENLFKITSTLQAKEDDAIGLKLFNASLIESSLITLQTFPIDYQRRIHEFRNQLSVLNQEIEKAIDWQRMTFDSTISDHNHQTIKTDLKAKYINIQGICKRTADRLQPIIEYNSP